MKVGVHVTSVLVGISAAGAEMDMDERRELGPLLEEAARGTALASYESDVTIDIAASLQRSIVADRSLIARSGPWAIYKMTQPGHDNPCVGR